MTQRGRNSRKFSYCSNMTRRGSLILICAYLAFIAATVAADQEECNKTKCPGPLAYYKDLGCTPVYENEGDCCAIRYNCDHIKERSTSKCYVNGHEYEIGDKLREEDANPCDIGCTCSVGHKGIAAFICAIVDCPFFGSEQPGCYRKRSPLDCCPGHELVCPGSSEDRATCNVDGKEYKEGEYFSVENEPDLSCICQPGYEGKNVEPFCVRPKRPYCSPDFRNAYDVFSNCPPVYYSNQSPQTSCSVFSRCQNINDTIIHNEDNSKSAEKSSDDKDTCRFGDMIMHRGDELNQATDYNSVCVRCVCDVPPLPTCQRLPDEECDVSKHPPFTNYENPL